MTQDRSMSPEDRQDYKEMVVDELNYAREDIAAALRRKATTVVLTDAQHATLVSVYQQLSKLVSELET